MSKNQPISGRKLLLENLELIVSAIRQVATCKRLSATEADSFRSYAYLKLMENDCRILARFRGESSLKTYLNRVVIRLLLDFRISRWGKWRPSADARRLGQPAIELERLVGRDGLRPEEAFQNMKAKGSPLTSSGFCRIQAKLPLRFKRRIEGEDKLAHLPAPVEAPEDNVLRSQRCQWRREIEENVTALLSSLDPTDRLILKLRFCDHCTVPEVSRRIGLTSKAIYRRTDRLLKTLRTRLEQGGIEAAMVAELAGRPSNELHFSFGIGSDSRQKPAA